MWFKYGLKAQKLLAQGSALNSRDLQKQHALNQRSPVRTGIENRWPKGKAKVKAQKLLVQAAP